MAGRKRQECGLKPWASTDIEPLLSISRRQTREGWGSDTYVVTPHQTDAIVYEMHHRDFSVHRNSGIVNKGKFVAMLEPCTESGNGELTGIAHLEGAWVTHVHILPSYDYNTVDETQLIDRQYNWGYDPLNYNVPGRLLFHKSCRSILPHPRDGRKWCRLCIRQASAW